jgi:hypothetical protein
VELKKFSKKKKKKKKKRKRKIFKKKKEKKAKLKDSKTQGPESARTWALKAKEKTSVLKNQSKNQERERRQSRAAFIYNRC